MAQPFELAPGPVAPEMPSKIIEAQVEQQSLEKLIAAMHPLSEKEIIAQEEKEKANGPDSSR